MAKILEKDEAASAEIMLRDGDACPACGGILQGAWATEDKKRVEDCPPARPADMHFTHTVFCINADCRLGNKIG